MTVWKGGGVRKGEGEGRWRRRDVKGRGREGMWRGGGGEGMWRGGGGGGEGRGGEREGMWRGGGGGGEGREGEGKRGEGGTDDNNVLISHTITCSTTYLHHAHAYTQLITALHISF